MLGTKGEWIGVGCAAVYLVVLFGAVAALQLASRVTFQVLKAKTNIDGLKKVVKNIWTNCSLVGALLLTIDIGMLQQDAEPFGGDVHKYGTAYACFIGLAAMQHAQATIECGVHIVYTEALTEAGVIRYCIAHSSCIGRPAFMCIQGLGHLSIGLCIWVLVKYGLPACIFVAFTTVKMYIILGYNVLAAHRFSPDIEKENRVNGRRWGWAVGMGEIARWRRCLMRTKTQEMLKGLAEKAALWEENHHVELLAREEDILEGAQKSPLARSRVKTNTNESGPGPSLVPTPGFMSRLELERSGSIGDSFQPHQQKAVPPTPVTLGGMTDAHGAQTRANEPWGQPSSNAPDKDSAAVAIDIRAS